MLRIARFVLLAAAVTAPIGCVSGGTTTSDRLDKLEAQMKTTQTYDLRIAHLEDRLTLLEQDLGRVRAGGPGPRVVEPIAVPAAPAKTKPVSAAPAAATPVSATSAPPPMSSPDTAPAAGKPTAEAPESSSAGPVQAALADLTATAPRAGTSEYYAGGRKVDPSPEAAGPAPAPAVAKKAGSAAAGPQASYDAALALFEGRKYKEAKAAFEDFIAANPGHSLRPNAQYWVGECQYSQGDYSGAILNFTDVAGSYPTHPKAAAALLKAGYAYANLGDQENARFYWQMLRHDFPKSSEARLAAKRMGTAQ